MTNKKTIYKATALHYSVTGNGMPVVLLHGFAEDGSVWEKQVAFLENNFRLIIPDIPGSGKTQLLNGADISLVDYADCLKAIINAENISSFVLIGHSMGGYISLAYLEKYPADLIALGLFHSTAYPDDAVKIETRKKAIEFIQSNGAGPFLKTSIPGLFSNSEKNNVEIENLLKKGEQFSDNALIQYYNAMINRPARTEVLKNAQIPLLFIGGIHDKAVPINHTLEQTHLSRLAYLHILRESAHMGMLEETEKVNGILANFLESCSF